MFMKPFRVKTNVQLKGTERKKFRSQLETYFPPFVDESAFPLSGKEEVVSSAKVCCHNNDIVYVFSVNKDPVAFEFRGKLFPTVYGLWKAPSSLTVVFTWGAVFKRMANGADLMAPGVVLGNNSEQYMQIRTGDIVQIGIVGCRQAVGVGTMLMDGNQMVASDRKGKAVQIVHLYGDFLWEMGSKTEVEFDRSTNEGDVVEEEELVEETSGQVGDTRDIDGTVDELNDVVEEVTIDDDPRTPTQRMDELIKECFLSALKCSGKHIEVPLLTNIFYSNYVMTCAPEGQTVEVKKSSFKKVSTFLSKMKALGYIDIKEEKKGVEAITKINLELLRDFTVKPDFLPKAKETTSSGETVTYQMPEIRQVFLVTAEVLPLFKGYGKGSAVTLEDVRAQIKKYVVDNELQSPTDKGRVNLEPVLAHIVLARNEYDSTVTWEVLNRRVLSKCSSAYEICVPGREPVLKKGAIDPISISIGTRSGNKKVTLIHGFETFGIDPASFAHLVQVGVSASTTVNPLPNNNKGYMQVLIQGNQTNFVAKLLQETYKLPKNYIRGLENAPKPKKK